jgi:Outer membrane receptor for ferrienterochelin and colicins
MTKHIISVFLFFISLPFFAQNYTISGYVTDGESGETMISAAVFDAASAKGVVTNAYGFYSITIPKGKVQLSYSYVGYSSQKIDFTLSKDTVINIKLAESVVLKEVVITGGARKEFGVQGSQMSAIEVPISQIKTVPMLFGETDVLKALQLLPGVQSGTEGSAGFYVRGGGPDENLFLLDGIPIYNVNHMGGFFSVFNADAIKNVTLYKGGFPARFGGRLSSVLDVTMNDGNNKKIKGNASIGLISSKINLEGPILSENTTFNISARRTYYDILTQPLLKWYQNQQGNDTKLSAGYYFYDLNAKVSHKFSDRDKLFLSFYMGDDAIYANIRLNDQYDDFTSEERTKMNWRWGNMITALRWNHVINNKLFMNVTGAFTRYRFFVEMGMENVDNSSRTETSLGYNSGIVDYTGKVDFDYSPNPSHDIKFGTSYTNHTFRPGVVAIHSEERQDTVIQNTNLTIGDKPISAHEMTLYVEDNWNIGNILKANIGLHASAFQVQDKFYPSIQPRVSARLLLSEDLSLKTGYSYMSQYIHLLSNSDISLPTDLWVPVTNRILPMNSHQISLGLFYNFLNLFDVSVEGYYKEMNNLLEYKEGASFFDASNWEQKVCMGRGWAYGIEFLAQKTVGKTTGWLGYTWAKSERKFDREGEVLNFGKTFPAKYDRRHDVSIVVSHKFNKAIDVAATWVFSTGSCGTLATQNYYGIFTDRDNDYSTCLLPYIEQRNNFRMPNYHRLDLGVNFHKKHKRGTGTWNVSVYNAYNQNNPFFVYLDDYKKKLMQVSIFPIMPSVSYSFKF